MLLGGTRFVEGKVGMAFNFHSAGDGVRLNPAPINSRFAFDAWIRRHDPEHVAPLGTNATLFYFSGTNETTFHPGPERVSIGIRDDGRLFARETESDFPSMYVSEGSIQDTNWHHIAVTSGGGVYFYIDGAVAGEYGGRILIFNDKPYPDVYLGTSGDDPTATFNGSIDEASLHQFLTREEVGALFAAGSAGRCPLPEIQTASAHWSFDEVEGAKVIHDDNGDVEGEPSPTGAELVPGGVSGEAIQLDAAANGYVDLGSPSWTGNPGFSVVLWVRMAPGESGGQIALSESGGTGFELGVGASGDGQLWLGPDFGDPELVQTFPVADQAWHQLCMTSDPDQNRTSFFVDGQLSGRWNSTPPVPSGRLIFGGDVSGSGAVQGRFTGWIDDVQVYDSALTEEEVGYLDANPGLELYPRTPPVILVQPEGAVLDSVAPMEFRVIARGAPPLTYEWDLNGEPLGETNATLTTTVYDYSAAYSVKVSNPFGVTISDLATVEIHRIPWIPTGALANEFVAAGTNWVLTANGGGTPPLEYTWRRDGEVVQVTTNATLIITNVRPEDAGTYSVQATNAYGSTGIAELAVLNVLNDSSLDGLLTNWTVVRSSTNETLLSVAFGDGVYVAVGTPGQILRSTNGISWESVDAGFSNAWYAGVTYAKGMFAMIGDLEGTSEASVFTSPNGVSWTKRYQWVGDFATGYFSPRGIVYAGDHFLGYGNDRGRFARWVSSEDGINWTPLPTSFGSTMTAFAYGDGYYEANVAYPMSIHAYSTNGLNWVETRDFLYPGDVTFGNHRFVFIDAVSTNGVDLIRRTRDPEVNHLSFARDVFFGTGPDGKLAVSEDGFEWQDRDSGTDVELIDSASDGERVVLVGDRGTILISGDAGMGDGEVHLSNPVLDSDGFKLFGVGMPGDVYTLQKMNELMGTWTDIVTRTNARGSVLLLDPAATNDAAFYRVHRR